MEERNDSPMDNDLAKAALEMTEENAAVSSEVSVAELDAKIKTIREIRGKLDALELQETQLKGELNKSLLELQPMLEALGRTTYSLPDVGTVYKHVDNSYKMPQALPDKVALFEYIKNKYGEDTFLGYMSIHHASLNSFVKAEKEAGSYNIPGLAAPTPFESIRFRKA